MSKVNYEDYSPIEISFIVSFDSFWQRSKPREYALNVLCSIARSECDPHRAVFHRD